MNEAIRMQISAFTDGELPDNEKELLLRRLSQDAEMRRQVAEYLAIGRAMRGEMPVSGIDSLRDRIADEIGAIDSETSKESSTDSAAAASSDARVTRPLAGFAIAATVALVAIFGLRQVSEEAGQAGELPQAADIEAGFPTQPEADNVLDQYRLLHDAEAADSSMRTRFTSIEIRGDIADENEVDGAAEEDAVPADPDRELMPDTE